MSARGDKWDPHSSSLPAISDQSATSREALRLTITAKDADLPANTLSYAWEPGAPQGAAIDPASGEFLWTATTAQEGTTNRIAIRVTDNGVPLLSETQTFLVVVPARASAEVRLSGLMLPDGSVRLAWTAIPGRTYIVQRPADLAIWEDVATLNATASSLKHVAGPATDGPIRIYRVVQR